MGETTKLANLLDPQVLADYIDQKLVDYIRFAPLATVDTTLVGAPGSILTFPAYSYISAASDLTEGSAISTVSLNYTSASAQIKEIGKAVEITDTAILSAYGDPQEEIAKQLMVAIADKVDIDFLTILGGIAAGMTKSTTASTCAIAVADISDALELFGEDIDGQKALLVSPRTYTKIRNTKDWCPASEYAAGALVKGAVGQIFGCDVIVTNRLRQTAVAGEKAFIVKPGALRLILKRDTMLETDRDILRRVNVFTATKHYVNYLYNAAGAIKIMTPAS